MKIAKSPNGALIIGITEIITGIAQIHGVIVKDDGTLEPSYAGETEVDWDSQRPILVDDQFLFQDDNGLTWTSDQLVLEDEPDDAAAEAR